MVISSTRWWPNVKWLLGINFHRPSIYVGDFESIRGDLDSCCTAAGVIPRIIWWIVQSLGLHQSFCLKNTFTLANSKKKSKFDDSCLSENHLQIEN
jgi:hypothetical protein